MILKFKPGDIVWVKPHPNNTGLMDLAACVCEISDRVTPEPFDYPRNNYYCYIHTGRLTNAEGWVFEKDLTLLFSA